MALTERLQILIESLGGSTVVGEFRKIGDSAKTEFDKAASAGDRAAAQLKAAQDNMARVTAEGQAKIAASTDKLEQAQLKAVQSAAAVERAQAKVAAMAPGTDAAAIANEKLATAELKAAQAAQSVEAAEAKVAAATKTATESQAVAASGVTKAEAEVAKLSSTSGVGSAALQKLGIAGVSTGDALKTGVAAGVSAVGLALAGLATKGVSEFASATAEVRKLKAATGESAEEASKLRNVAIGLGVDTDTLTKGMFKLVTNLEKAKGDLAGVHVEIARGKDGNVDYGKTLDNLRAGYQSLTDAGAKNQYLLDAFKKTGLDLRPILSATNDEFERMKKNGPIFSDKDLQSGRDYAIAQRELGQAVKELEIDLARGLVPTLTAVENAFSAVVKVTDAIHLPLGEVIALGAVTLGAAKGLEALAVGTGKEAAAAAAGTAANAALATSEAAVGAAASGAAAKQEVLNASVASGTGKLSTFALGAKGLGLVLQYEVAKAGADWVSKTFDLKGAFDRNFRPGLVEMERHIPLVGGFLANLDDKSKAAANSTKTAGDASKDAADKLQQESDAAAQAAADQQKLVDSGQLSSAALKDLGSALGGGIQKFTAFEDKAYDTRSELDKLKTSADALQTAFDKALGGTVSLDKAEAGFKSSLDAVKQSLADNGKTLDLNTEAGRKNVSAIDAVVTGIKDHVDAMVAQGASADDLRGKWNSEVESLKGVLRQMGFNKDEIQNLIDKYGLVPKTIDTAVQLSGTNKAIQDAETVANDIAAKLKIAHEAALISVQVFGADKAEAELAKLKADAGNIAVKGYEPPQSQPVPSNSIANGPLPEPGPSAPSPDAGELLHAATGRKIQGYESGGLPTKGFVTDGPKFLVGEGNPVFDEYVIATDPAYKGRNVSLWKEAGEKLGTLPENADLHDKVAIDESSMRKLAYGGRLEDDPNYRPGMTNDDLARLSESQPFGETNISATDGYHAGWTRTSGLGYYTDEQLKADGGYRVMDPGEEGALPSDKAFASNVATGGGPSQPGWTWGNLSGSGRFDEAGFARAIARELGALICDKVGTTNVGPFHITAKSSDRLPESIAREVRRELYLAGR